MKNLKLGYLRSGAHVHALMRARGLQPSLSQAVLAAALKLLQPSSREDHLQRAAEFFRSKAVLVPDGLSDLPSAWLADLPRLVWRSRKPHWHEIPYMCRRLAFSDGVLCISFAQELPTPEHRLTAWDKLRIELNLGLRPNLWLPLPPSLERTVWTSRPDLRRELFLLPS